MPDAVNSETLPFPFAVGKQKGQSGGPQPKLLAHTEPCGSTVTPYPPPKRPPPITGESGVSLVPSDGLPFGWRTTMNWLEYGVPWRTLLVIQAYPLESNTRLPSPPNELTAGATLPAAARQCQYYFCESPILIREGQSAFH